MRPAGVGSIIRLQADGPSAGKPKWTSGKLAIGHMNRRLTPLYGIIAGVLAAISAVLMLVGTGLTNPRKESQSWTIGPVPLHTTPADLVVLVVIVSIVILAGLLAVAFYWRTKSVSAQTLHEDARRQREEVEKTLKRLRERMSLPSLLELNRLMLTEYHSIATNQAQKSFKSSQRAMLGGFTWLIACFTAVMFIDSLYGRIIAAAMAPVGSILAAFLSRTYLFVYDRALVQLSHYYSQPLLNSYYLAAERLTNEMSPEARDRLLGKVVEQLLGVAGSLSDGPGPTEGARKGMRVKIPSMRKVPANEDGSKENSVTATPSG
jgi:hypothetical protein